MGETTTIKVTLERIPSPPPGLFKGNNFMTPHPVAYFKGLYAGRTVYVEVSKEGPPYWEDTVERKPNPRPLVGITYRRADGCRLDPDPSTCVHGLDEAAELLGVNL